MSHVYDHTDFTPAVVPGGYDKETRDLIAVAVEVGWTLIVTSSGGVTITSPKPDQAKTLRFNTGTGGLKTPRKQLRKTVLRFADQKLVDAAEAKRFREQEALRQAEEEALKRAAEEAAKKRAAMPKSSEPKPGVQREPVVAPKAIPSPAQVAKRVQERRHIVSEYPMIAYRSGSRVNAKGYEAESTLERKWSDGTVDYACRFPGCDFTSSNRKGPGTHWRTHVSKGEAQPIKPPRSATIDAPHEPTYTREGYTPRKDRVAALMRFLDTMSEDELLSTSTLAEKVLEWMHEQSEQNTAFAGEREPLTAEQVLDRIRGLVDQGQYMRQRDENVALQAQVAAMKESLAEANQRAEKAVGTLTAFYELADELKKEA